ncbi:putative 39S ribosomal protein L55, mitochondrial [Apostichopus japonicus]|uniref:Putative 39S ribosomal protein L55, mitochondrial n=1 Tax=Stichopus japonicus TaxID=307972 RepID=A0A2G8K792_STIJA|nr:putative 39S ribosomal protein L55, mitochondrial [Apostichopus japonicus]
MNDVTSKMMSSKANNKPIIKIVTALRIRFVANACLWETQFNAFTKCSTVTLNSRWNSNRASIAKTNRKVYARLYPTVIVNPDGSTYRIKYNEPRKLLYLPFDVNSLTLEEKKARLAKYQAKRKQDLKDDLDDNFDARKYKQFWMSKKT